jgi:hypothetical protein
LQLRVERLIRRTPSRASRRATSLLTAEGLMRKARAAAETRRVRPRGRTLPSHRSD